MCGHSIAPFMIALYCRILLSVFVNFLSCLILKDPVPLQVVPDWVFFNVAMIGRYSQLPLLFNNTFFEISSPFKKIQYTS